MRMKQRKWQRGASLVHWLIALIPLMGFGALAVDLNNVYVSLGQLQNAADAGALEGARLLYVRDPVTGELVINTSSNSAAQAVAEANLSQGSAPEVTVERGHWMFETNRMDAQNIERGGTFFPNPTTDVNPLIDPITGNFKAWQQLNLESGEINAVRVVAARSLTPVQAFFGPLLGIDGYQAQASAVAYVGFAGSVAPFEFDMPIAMCDDILQIGQGCQVGRLVPEPGQTAGWTNMDAATDGSCNGAASGEELRTLVGDASVCPNGGGINLQEVTLGAQIPVNNGQVNTAFNEMYDCWKNNPALDTDGDGWPDRSMEWFLPVVHGCSFGGQCASVIGGVRVEVLWMFSENPDSAGVNGIDNTAPRSMGPVDADGNNWDIDPATPGAARWDSFVAAFNLEMDSNHTPATWANGGAIQKTIYFKPSCEPVVLGGTGGSNFGVRAGVPRLVY